MAKIINEKPAETIYTLELTQKELNTFVRFIGSINGSDYRTVVCNDIIRINSDNLLTWSEATELYDNLRHKTTYQA